MPPGLREMHCRDPDRVQESQQALMIRADAQVGIEVAVLVVRALLDEGGHMRWLASLPFGHAP